jgi:glycosyltransferase involved in cell wall biosynthesis
VRMTLIGPAFPWRGGIPLLVTDLALRLSAAGHQVTLRTWTRQGPARLLPAQRFPLSTPESGTYPTVRDPLSWRNPVHWRRAGRRSAAESELVVLVFYTTLQAVALAAIARHARPRARVVLICANAVPHEPRPGDRRLTSLLADSVDAILVHTPAERAALAELTDRPITVAALPPHLPAGPPGRGHRSGLPRHRLLFFGKVRPYKGIDVLLQALTRLPDVQLTIAGELYRSAADLPDRIARAGLADRVVVRPGYLPAAQIPELFGGVDALVLPYRTATASQLVALAHEHGLPTVVTRVGNFPDVVTDGVDGLVCAPGDVDDLVRALRELYRPGRLAALRAAVWPTDAEPVWRDYLDTLLALTRPAGRPTGGRALAGGTRAAQQRDPEGGHPQPPRGAADQAGEIPDREAG